MAGFKHMLLLGALGLTVVLNGCAVAATQVLTTHLRHASAPSDYDAAGFEPAAALSGTPKPAPELPVQVSGMTSHD